MKDPYFSKWMFHCLNIISLYIFEGVKRALVYQKDCQTRIEEAKLQNEKLELNCNHKGTAFGTAWKRKPSDISYYILKILSLWVASFFSSFHSWWNWNSEEAMRYGHAGESYKSRCRCPLHPQGPLKEKWRLPIKFAKQHKSWNDNKDVFWTLSQLYLP